MNLGQEGRKGQVILTKRYRGNLDNSKDRHPIPSRRDGLHLGPCPRRGQLGGVEPRHRKPSHAIKQLEDEDEGRCSVRRALGADRQQYGDHHKAETETGRADHEQ